MESRSCATSSIASESLSWQMGCSQNGNNLQHRDRELATLKLRLSDYKRSNDELQQRVTDLLKGEDEQDSDSSDDVSEEQPKPKKAKTVPAAAAAVDDGKVASVLLTSIARQITSQMVYKKSLKTGKARVTAEIPNVTYSQVSGTDHASTA